jgi:hypothetical protein
VCVVFIRGTEYRICALCALRVIYSHAYCGRSTITSVHRYVQQATSDIGPRRRSELVAGPATCPPATALRCTYVHTNTEARSCLIIALAQRTPPDPSSPSAAGYFETQATAALAERARPRLSAAHARGASHLLSLHPRSDDLARRAAAHTPSTPDFRAASTATATTTTTTIDGDDELELADMYGAAEAERNGDSGDARSGESAALLGGGSGGAERAKRDGHASLTSCVSNLANTIIGSGASPFRVCLHHAERRAHRQAC